MAARRSTILSALAPVLLFLTLGAWSIASPVGASPDDDFHLVSIWCATGDDERCEMNADGRTATVPEALVESSCYAFYAERSGDCQDRLDYRGPADTETARGNFFGAYPPVFYEAMSIFVGDDIGVSVILMRLATSFLFTLLATALFLLLPVARRQTLVWSWVLTTVPLGVFILASNNPSSWAVAGVGLGWLALVGWFETSGARKVGLGAIFVLSVLMAAGSRGDASLYMVLAILAVLVLTMHRTRRFALEAILPVAAMVFCVLMFRVSRPVEDITQGVEPDSGLSDMLARILPTAFDVPALWMGIFGKGWGLGWLDIPMPAFVWVGALACAVGASIVAGVRIDLRKALVLGGGFLVLLFLPTAVLVAGGQPVGENVQPRYLLPLIVLFVGVVFWAPAARQIRFGRVQRWLTVGVLAVAHALALHLNLGRYVLGFDDLGPNLDSGVEWWWSIPLSPMAVLIVGSLAYAALLALLIGRTEFTRVAVAEPEQEPTPPLQRTDVR